MIIDLFTFGRSYGKQEAMNFQSTNRRQVLRKGLLLAAGGSLVPRQLMAVDIPSADNPVPKVKIASVKTYLLQHRLKRPFGVSISVPLSTTRSALLVKIETDSGLVGWGETAVLGGVRGAIETKLAPLLIGRNPLEYRTLWRLLWGANFGDGRAVGAVDVALNDLRGKVLNLPTTALFGGPMRNRIPAYASAMNYVEGRRPEQQFPDEAAALVQQGYKALKMRIGRHSVARDGDIANRVREAVGPDIQLMADGNAGYTMGTAIRMGDKLYELGYDFFEEPLPQSPKYAGYDKLVDKLRIPLAAGEAVDSRAAAKDLIDRRAMDIIQPDVSLCGGIGTALFIAELAALSGNIRCIPHCWGSDIVTAATIQFLALLPDPHWGFPTHTPLLEMDLSENPWRREIMREPIEVRGGFVDVPQKPGLGIEVDEDAVRKFAVQ